MTYGRSKQCCDRRIAILTAITSRDVLTKLLGRHMACGACTISALQCYWQLRHVTSQHMGCVIT